MKKNSTKKEESLRTWGFTRICTGNFLLFTSIYLLLPLLPDVVNERIGGISAQETIFLFLSFIFGMFAVGPFHAYLGDTYKRKNVLIYSTVLLAASGANYLWVDSFAEVLLLAFMQGVCFGVATTAGITVAIDMTPSKLRNDGNVVYSLCGRLGMLTGMGAGVWAFREEGSLFVVYLSLFSTMLSILLSMRIYLPFRAPIGMKLCSSDRFLLKRGWFLALNVLLFALFPGMLLPFVSQGNKWIFFVIFLLAVAIIPFTRLFIKLSQHCQRGSANTTCQLAMDAGILSGMAVAYGYIEDFSTVENISHCVLGGVICTTLIFLFLTYPYYQKKRVRQ